jgi:hypothetical protein
MVIVNSVFDKFRRNLWQLHKNNKRPHLGAHAAPFLKGVPPLGGGGLSFPYVAPAVDVPFGYFAPNAAIVM